MHRTVLKSKIHRARVTATNKEYEGSVTIDRALLDAADIKPHELVQIVNVSNGERFKTYAIAGDEKEVCLNGAAARLVEPGDIVIVLSYRISDKNELPAPTIISVDEVNQIIETDKGS
jgi:aspartate 1-decarboxylase